MPKTKAITKSQLRVKQNEAFAVIKAWVKYLDALNDYQLKLDNSVRAKTTPPGNPPNPPGIPPR